MNTSGMSPFKFLDAYEEQDKDRFFGREKETAQLYNAVYASNLTLLYGASGTGKTSLVRCGLANKFYDTDWLPIFIRREENINQSLYRALKAKHDPEVQGWQEDDITRQVEVVYRSHYRPVYLLFDQFEELYILGKKAEQDQFHQTIADLIAAGLQAKVIFILREEWIASMNEFEKVIPFLFDNRLRIERMNDQTVRRVVHNMCAAAGVQVDEPQQTIEMIVSNLHDRQERVDLTNLQVYLDRLWRKAAESSTRPVVFHPALVQDVGKMDNVLSDFLDEQLKEVEQGLASRGVENAKGLPLEILFTMVTEDGTKQQMVTDDILQQLPRSRQLTAADLDYCLEEFKRIKVLRPLG